MFGQFRAHPVGKAIGAFVALLVAVLGIAQLVETAWGLASTEPLLPFIGEWLGSWRTELMQALLILGFAAVTAWALVVQFRILAALRVPEIEDELPENTTWADGYLTAGSDMPFNVPSKDAKTADSVTFTARQGTKYLFKDKAGEVDSELGQFRLPFTVAETKRLKTGYVLLEVTFRTVEGTRKANLMAIKTIESL